MNAQTGNLNLFGCGQQQDDCEFDQNYESELRVLCSQAVGMSTIRLKLTHHLLLPFLKECVNYSRLCWACISLIRNLGGFRSLGDTACCSHVEPIYHVRTGLAIFSNR